MDHFDEALKHINAVIEKQPLARGLHAASSLVGAAGELDEAIKDLDAARQAGSGGPAPLLMRSRLYHAEGRNALALQDVDRVSRRTRIARSPAICELHSGRHGELRRGGTDISELLEEDPENVLLKLQLAIYLNAAGSRAKAIEVFRDVLQADPQHGVALRGRADAYLNVGEHRKPSRTMRWRYSVPRRFRDAQ